MQGSQLVMNRKRRASCTASSIGSMPVLVGRQPSLRREAPMGCAFQERRRRSSGNRPQGTLGQGGEGKRGTEGGERMAVWYGSPTGRAEKARPFFLSQAGGQGCFSKGCFYHSLSKCLSRVELQRREMLNPFLNSPATSWLRYFI